MCIYIIFFSLYFIYSKCFQFLLSIIGVITKIMPFIIDIYEIKNIELIEVIMDFH